jgi:hypothetical protein
MDYINQYIFDPAGLNGGGVIVQVFEQEGGGGGSIIEKSKLAIPGGLVVYHEGGNVDDVNVDMAKMEAGSIGDDISGGSSSSSSSSSSSGSSSGSSSVSESIISDDLFDSLLKRVYTPNDAKILGVTKTKTNNKRNKKNRTKKVSSK